MNKQFETLYERIVAGEDKIALVGLGYVGMPIAVEFAKYVKVIGFNHNENRIKQYKSGIDPTHEVGDGAIAKSTVDFTSDEKRLAEAKFIIVAVPTPVNTDHTPDLYPVENASRIVGRNMVPGTIVCYYAIPDGGALISKKELEGLEINNYDANLLEAALWAFQLKKEYMQNNIPDLKTQFRAKYSEVNEMIENNVVLQKASSVSLDILYSLDAQIIREKRKENYLQLYNGLKAISGIQFVLDDNLTGVVPMFFPIYVENRAALQRYAGMNNVYCPVIWPKSNLVTNSNSETDFIYNHILCIPIDQRYGFEEMNRIIDVFQHFYSN